MIKLAPFAREAIWYENAKQLRILCREINRKILVEGDSSFTEVVHEIFCAMAIGGAPNPNNFSHDGKKLSINDWDDPDRLTSWVNKSKKLNDKPTHIGHLKNFMGKPKWKKEALKQWIDASKIHSHIKSFALKINGVERVFGTEGGTKYVADIRIDEGGSQKLSVSLKSGKGQVTNLSPAKIMTYMYPEAKYQELRDQYKTKDKVPLLDFLYSKSSRKEEFIKFLDRGCRAYVHWVIKGWIKHRDGIIEENDRVTPAITKMMDDIVGYKKGVSKNKQKAKANKWINALTWKPGWMSGGQSSKFKKSLQYVYRKGPLASDPSKKKYGSTKQMFINKIIDSYFTGTPKPDVVALIVEVLRCETNTSYLYAGSAGKKLSFIPSADDVLNQEKNLTAEVNQSLKAGSDWVRNITIKNQGTKILTFDLRFRFAGDDGQWATDLSHKGSVLELHPGFWTTFTSRPAGRWG